MQLGIPFADLLKISVVQQRFDQYHEAGACVMYQGAGSGIQNTQDGQGDCQQVDAHGQGDAEFNCFYT